MNIVNHMATGAVLALSVKTPVLAVVLSYVSHFVLDAMPHFGFQHSMDVFERNKQRSFRWYLIIGGVFTVIGVPLLFIHVGQSVSVLLLMSCLIASILPDLVWVPRFIYEIRTRKERPKGRISAFHAKIQNDSVMLGGIVEFVWLAAMGLLIISLA